MSLYYVKQSEASEFGVKFFCKVEWLLATVTSIIVYSDDQGEGRAERHYPGNRRCPGSLAVLDLHPAVHVVTCNADKTDKMIVRC